AKQRFDLGPFVAGIQNTRLTTHGGAFNWTRIMGPTVVNELRLGFAKTNPQTRQSDFGTKAAESLGIQGINVTEFTSGLPNIGMGGAPGATGDLTGISGGPAFLPVNPKQTHYQLEDTVSWVKDRHSLKTGYRFILRRPSPFSNTDTRGSITIGRNLTNNPVTNSGGSGFAWDVTGNSRNIVRGGYGRSFFPIPQSASNLRGQQVPYTISQNYSVETNPLDYSRVPLISNPFPTIRQIQPRTTAELNAANPRVLGHAFSNETPSMQTWQVSYERQLTNSLMGEVAYVGSIGSHLIWCFNPNEVQPGPGSQASRRLLKPLSNLSNMLQCDATNHSSYNSLQTKLLKRFSHGLQFLASYTFGKSLDHAG